MTYSLCSYYEIRQAVISDAAQIAVVNTQSWKETYPGIVPEKKLASLNLESCTHNWTNTLSQNQIVWVAIVNGQIVGFASGGKNRIHADCETGLGNACECELTVIYILKAFHKLGIGKALLGKFVKQMLAEGYKDMVVWVAELNPATEFYARMGGVGIDRKVMFVIETEVPEIAYKYELTKYLF